jgi:hypothetical protein
VSAAVRIGVGSSDRSRANAFFGLPKIWGFDPLLTSVWTAHTTQPLSPLFHPPIELASGGPRGCLDLDRRIDLAAICFGVIVDLHV